MMIWEKASEAQIDCQAYYLVKTNGGEWGDMDFAVWRGFLVAARMEPHYVRGRPSWVAKVTDPGTLARNSAEQRERLDDFSSTHS